MLHRAGDTPRGSLAALSAFVTAALAVVTVGLVEPPDVAAALADVSATPRFAPDPACV